MDSTSKLESARQKEQEYWNSARIEQSEDVTVLDPLYVKRNLLRPCFEGHGDLYSENRMLFHQIIRRDGGWAGKYVLDYGCGLGNWAIYFAQTGARKVVGFDMCASGIQEGMKRVRQCNLEAKVKLVQMDASHLTFPDNEFDMVIGTGVLHHTIKYPGIFENLYRVMKPDTKAYFSENLADFFIWRLWWALKGEVPEGDVPIFSKEVRKKADMFSKVEIIGDSFIHSIKSFVYKYNMSPLRRKILRISYAIDQFLFKVAPITRRWGCMSVIVLTK